MSAIANLLDEPLADAVLEIALIDRDRHRARGFTFGQSLEQLMTDRRQYRVRQYRVDHATTAFRLRAARGDQLGHVFTVAQDNVVILLDARHDSSQL